MNHDRLGKIMTKRGGIMGLTIGAALIMSMAFPAQAEVVTLAPPVKKLDIPLKPDDPAVTVNVEWYCPMQYLGTLTREQHRIAQLTAAYLKVEGEVSVANSKAAGDLVAAADLYLQTKESSADIFWFYKHPGPWTLNPAPGKSVSRSEEDCYTMKELEVAKREALRWANWVMKNYK